MSLKYGILGCLTMQPRSGYDLAKLFDRTINYFWSASHSQIYRTLNQMLAEGLVTYDRIEQVDYPDKKVYSITDTGRDELKGWLATPHDQLTVRHEFLVQLTFGNLLSDAEVLHIMEVYAASMRQRLALYQNPSPFNQFAASERELFFWNLAGKAGRASTEAEIRWIETAIAEFKQLMHLK